MDWSFDQKRALETILDGVQSKVRQLVLTGNAGTGKTTLTKEIIKFYGKNTLCLAPTGKATVRIRELTDHSAYTIHSMLYDTVLEDDEGNPIFLNPTQLCDNKKIVIIDEASMIGSRLYNDLINNIPEDITALFVGDDFQLPPVKDKPGVNLKSPDIRLTTIHRQRLESPVVALATDIRFDKGYKFLKEYKNDQPTLQKSVGQDLLIKNVVDEIKNNIDTIALAYTHRTRQYINSTIREKLGHTKQIVPGDRLIVKTNNYTCNLYNGEIYTVEKTRFYNSKVLGPYWLIHFEGIKKPFKIKTNQVGISSSDFRAYVSDSILRKNKVPRNLIHVDYGFCVTIHASQGSQWDSVHYLHENAQVKLYYRDKDTSNKMMYTGCTRTTNKLHFYREI